MINFSIIIPHHNIPDLLSRLIDTIPQREDIEIIVVDDNSNEDKKPKPEEFRKDVQFVFLDKEHSKGAGRARNVGIERAIGKWLIFADSDDFFKSELYNLINKYEDNEEDVIYFLSESVDNQTLKPVSARTDEANQMVLNNDLNNLRYHHYVPWSKMVKKKMVDDNHLRYEEVEVSNDAMFSVLIGIHARSVLAVPEIMYVSTVRSGSLFYTKTLHMAIKRYEVKLHINKLLLDNGVHKYKPNLITASKTIKPFSKKEFKHCLIAALKNEGIIWFLYDALNVMKSKMKFRKI